MRTAPWVFFSVFFLFLFSSSFFSKRPSRSQWWQKLARTRGDDREDERAREKEREREEPTCQRKEETGVNFARPTAAEMNSMSLCQAVFYVGRTCVTSEHVAPPSCELPV